MALLVETGLGVLGANSYVTLEEARSYATERGITTLPATDPALEALLVKAMDWLEAQREEYKGTKTYPAPEFAQWPRLEVQIDDYEIEPTFIPRELKYAQCQLAIEFITVDPMATTFGQVVKRKKADVLEIEYAVNYREGPAPTRMPRVDAILAPLLKTVGLQVVRG